MRPERWQAIEELYHSASDLPDGQRNSFLQEACGEDQSLLYEVESLLRHGSRSQSVLDTPAMAIMAKAMAADESKSSAPFLPGTTVSHYRILEPIGRGGMGVVYKAEDLKLRRLVALKLLPQFLAADPQALHRFEREAQAASALNHPNICTVYQIGRVDDGFYLVMELVEGQPLSEMARLTKLTTEAVTRFGVQIADALAHAHDRQIVHRDLKGANVVITHDGRVKVLDFGLARRLDRATVDAVTRGQASLERDRSIVGTLPYMAPEQLQDLVRRKMLESIGIGSNKQLVVPFAELRNYVIQGFEFVAQLPNNEAIVRLPEN